jgi:hypothetical protein
MVEFYVIQYYTTATVVHVGWTRDVYAAKWYYETHTDDYRIFVIECDSDEEFIDVMTNTIDYNMDDFNDTEISMYYSSVTDEGVPMTTSEYKDNMICCELSYDFVIEMTALVITMTKIQKYIRGDGFIDILKLLISRMKTLHETIDDVDMLGTYIDKIQVYINACENDFDC